jgi:hypothetical protein
MHKADLITIRDRVLAKMAAQGFAGADPFDGLESRLFRASGLGRFRFARLCWLQAIKRGPRALRSVAMIPPMVNPKTLALLYGAAGGVPLRDFRNKLLAGQNSDGGWGYPFEWQARAFHAKRHLSNVIVTSFVVDALMADCGFDDQAALNRAADFIMRDLWRDGYFAYFAHDDAEIHNASLWAAFTLYLLRPSDARVNVAVTRVLVAQDEDGSWAYGRRHHHGFVDGFHTGYILDLLDRFRASGMDGLDDAIARGWQFYRAHCFTPDGLPRSFASRDGYLDAHAVAQAMASLCRFGDVSAAVRLASWAISNLFDPKRDVFFAGIGKLGRNPQNYMRWTQAWMVWGLSIVIENMAMEPFDPTAPLSFDHPDPNRVAKEAALRALPEDAFRNLYAITRQTAAQAKANGEMERLYGLTRGMKTMQRIGGERGVVFTKEVAR